MGTPEWAREVVLGAESVVLARVLGSERPRGNTGVSRAPFETVVLEVRRVLRGTAPPDTFRLPGIIHEFDLAKRKADDFIEGSPSCYNYAYRRLGLHLLLLTRDQHGELTANMRPLAPANREVRGPFDPWVLWVLNVIRNPSAPVGPMHAANDSAAPVFTPWFGWPAQMADMSGEIRDKAGRLVPHARLLASGFEVAWTDAKGRFYFAWPAGHWATLELQCESPSGHVVSQSLAPLDGRASLGRRSIDVLQPWWPVVPSRVCRTGDEAVGPRVVEVVWTAALDVGSFTLCRGFPRDLGPIVPRIDSTIAAAIRGRLRGQFPDRSPIRLRMRGVMEFAHSGTWEWDPPFAFRVHEVVDVRPAQTLDCGG